MAMAQKSFTEAEVRYKKAIKTKDEKYLEAEFNLGDALFKQGRYDDARQNSRALFEHPKTPPTIKGYAHFNIGNAHLQEFAQDPQENKDKIDESIESYKQALRMNPKDANARFNLEFARKPKAKAAPSSNSNNSSRNKTKIKIKKRRKIKNGIKTKTKSKSKTRIKTKNKRAKIKKKDNKQEKEEEKRARREKR